MAEENRLAELRNRIRREAPCIDRLPYSHNIVCITLQEIAQKYGTPEANKAVRDFGLECKGFSQEPETEPKT
jgi:hypothetical protein